MTRAAAKAKDRLFPINRRHQQVATYSMFTSKPFSCRRLFPINRRHQQVATRSEQLAALARALVFPINRRHQQVATNEQWADRFDYCCFQSIGVTNKWRPVFLIVVWLAACWGFQSIGVTNKWRQAGVARRTHRTSTHVSNQ